MYLVANGRSCVTFTKFLMINFRYVVFRAIAGLPPARNAVNLTEAIVYELRPGDVVSTEYVTEFKQLIFNILLLNACNEEAALNIVFRYERSDATVSSSSK
jgi:hypothetical protein